MIYAEIILPLRVAGTFTYLIPEELRAVAQCGMRVVVPFGGKKLYTGIVAELHDRKPETFLPKEIVSFLDTSPVIPEQQLRFWKWLSDYYLCELGEVYRSAVPSSLKLESETYIRRNPEVMPDVSLLNEHEEHLLQALEVRNMVSMQELEAFIPRREMMSVLNNLLAQHIIVVDEKISEKYHAREVSFLRIKEGLLYGGNLSVALNSLKRAPKQKALFLKIVELTDEKEPFIKKSTLFKEYAFTTSNLKPLLEKGYVEEFLEQKDRLESYDGKLEEVESLTEVQQQALTELREVLEEKNAVLLHGVTGSGKTHLYVSEIEAALERGENVLMLFPEVGLTKQIVRRLEKKYGQVLGFYHAKLSDFEKVEVWKRIRQNELKIILGTRHALFLPFQHLGLVVVDEEHDHQYRSTTVHPYFNARDAAMVLAGIYSAKTILGSATPSVESYYNSERGKIGRVVLNERYGDSTLPVVSTVDLKEAQSLKTLDGDFTFTLKDRIAQEIEQHRQVILLHNRRGYANVLECESCGFVQYCSNCDVVMTYHKEDHELKCHYCGQRAAVPKICPSCHSENLRTKGLGIQQLEEEVQKLFPEARVGRMDLDSMRKKYAYESFFEKVENRELDIIIGTQMVTKGLDFDYVDLVAVPRADSLLHVEDFRAEERAYQLLTQLAGRAGRTSRKGEMILQTYNPDRDIFRNLIKDKEEIYRYLIGERKKFYYPPFVKLVLIELKHRRENKVERGATFMGKVLEKYLPPECILGPEKSPIARINNLYQYQILLKLPKGKKYAFYKSFIRIAKQEFDEIKGYQSIKMHIYVDF